MWQFDSMSFSILNIPLPSILHAGYMRIETEKNKKAGQETNKNNEMACKSQNISYERWKRLWQMNKTKSHNLCWGIFADDFVVIFYSLCPG